MRADVLRKQKMSNWNDTIQKGQVGYMRDSQSLIEEGSLEALKTLFKKELKTCIDKKEEKELTAMHLDAIARIEGKKAAEKQFRRLFDG